ncbi:MAG: RidA family protein [Acidobacteriota bacterium]
MRQSTEHRTNISSGSPLEEPIGFSRACRIGQVIAVAGTAPIGDDGETVGPGDLYAQTRCCLEIALQAVRQAGGRPEDVIRTRILLTDIEHWEDAARAHGELFSDIKPACTFAQVTRFIDPEWLVEVELDCVARVHRERSSHGTP